MAGPLRQQGVPSPDDGAPIALICGGGSLPFAVARSLESRGRRVLLLGFRHWADPVAILRHRHHWVSLGQLGRIMRYARAEGCRDIVFIGTLVRPTLTQLRFDWITLRALPGLVRSFRGGDDHLLSGIARIFEHHGFRLRGAHEVAPDILVPEGALGRRAPSARDRQDIAQALALLAAIGPYDVGQAAVICDARVLAIEAAEGTDGLLDRVAQMRASGHIRGPERRGVLVKAPKLAQDRRFDLPAIGPKTVEGVARAGLAGLAVVAGETVIAEPDRVARLADELDVFVVGLPAHETLP
jgi:UDP-2,3-diacylglucosamine hydrolase